MSSFNENIAEQYKNELDLRKKIEEFYLPRQLVDAIVETGGTSIQSRETLIGIGFLDIARYTFLSQFLSPPENQNILNGLYSLFNWVLKKHGGYLNKLEGDSLMFHYGGPIDPGVKGLNDAGALKYIARELFYTCVELQRISELFNNTNRNILRQINDKPTVAAVEDAYGILNELRSGLAGSSFNAYFQIRIRVGASLGRVIIGNFGPAGAKQWDVIGMPVIEAKRMESTAPMGGLHITKGYYDILQDNGIADEYYQRIRREAGALRGMYHEIKFDELFRKTIVYLKDKNNASFETYSVQVSPFLPESIRDQVMHLFKHGEKGAENIVELIRYYRGNHFVLKRISEFLDKENVILRKWQLLKIIRPERYQRELSALDNDEAALKKKINDEYSLSSLLHLLEEIQSSLKIAEEKNISEKKEQETSKEQFIDLESWIEHQSEKIQIKYKRNKSLMHQTLYFEEVTIPLFFDEIKGVILERQKLDLKEAEEVEEL